MNTNNPSPPAASQVDVAPLIAQDLSLVGHVQVGLTAQLGSVQLSVEQLFKLRAGEVLSLQESLDAPVVLLLNGKPVARGELLAVDDHFGVRITEIA